MAPEIRGVGNRAFADRGGMGDVRIVLGDRLGPGLSLKGRDFLPEVVEHGVWRRVPVMGAPMHFAPRDHVDPRRLLFQDRRLHRAKLRVGKIGRLELSQGHQPVERLVPAWNTVRADDRGRVFWVPRHCLS